MDLSSDLEAHYFVDMEHLTEAGKEYVAEQVALAVKPEEPSPGDVPGDRATATPAPSPSPTLTRPPTRTPTPTMTPTQTTTLPSLTGTPPATATLAVTTPVPVTATATAGGTGALSAGDVTDVQYLGRYTPAGSYEVELYRITFQTVDEQSNRVETQADLFIPYTASERAFPVLAHAPGTTGIGDDCAPLDEEAQGGGWGSYRGHSLAYAAQGYIVVLPNWLYFDDPERSHEYFHSESQAHTLLDASRAVYRFWERDEALDIQAHPARAIFMMGYSSGGHAVFAARDYARRYAPGLAIRGVIGFGPTRDPYVLMQEDPVFSPYIVYAYRQIYGAEIIDPADVFLPELVPGFDGALLSRCVDDIFVTYSRSARRMYTPEFYQVLYDGRLAEVYPQFAEALAENASGLLGGEHIPVLILQGTADTVITPPSQRAFMEQLCAMGGSVTWLEYEAVSHVQTRWNSYRDVLAWMENIVEGGEPPSDCWDPMLGQ
jgi:pimeloyl-ACP methyl ester carboxylesterase